MRDSIEYHYERLRILRRKREDLLAASAGSGYPHSANQTGRMADDILNLMRQAAESMTISMAANRPRAIVVPSSTKNRAFASKMERAINTYARQLHLEEVLQQCVRNAFYSLGIAKVYQTESTPVMLEADEWMDPGRPFCGSISPNHFNYDTDATDFRRCSFLADRYQVRFHDLINDDRFEKKVRERIKMQGPQSPSATERQEWGQSLSASVSDQGTFEDYLFLTDVFLPKDGIIYTFPCDEQFRIFGEDPLQVIEWDGREEGPYHFLNLGPVPDKITPSSPAQNVYLLHNLANSLARKLRDQAMRQKQVMVVPQGGEDDGEKYRSAQDGESIVTTGSPADVVNLDGPNQQNYSFMMTILQQFSKQAGNLDLKLGLGSVTDTARQESMVNEQNGRVEAQYQNSFVKFTREIMQEIGKLLFVDNTTRITQTYRIPGSDIDIDDHWEGAINEGAREGTQEDYDIDVIPYSMAYKSPEDRLGYLDKTASEMLPALELLQQQGGTIDFRAWLDLKARYADMPEIRELFVFQDQEQDQQGQQPTGGPTAPPPKREYLHKSQNVPGQQKEQPIQNLEGPVNASA